jgi:hypothetical protein
MDGQPISAWFACPILRCLLAKTYSAAASLIDVELTEVDPVRTACVPTDLLLYCYYGGMIATGVTSQPVVGHDSVGVHVCVVRSGQVR